MNAPRVLLTTLSVRQSARGNEYLTGWLGKARVVAFSGEPDKHGNPTWDIFVASPEPRDGAPAPARDAQTGDRASGRTGEPASAAGRPGISYRAPRRESEQARQDRVAGEVAARHGVRSDADLDDDIPF